MTERRKVNIAIEGCCHGHLDVIYASIEHAQQVYNQRVDLLFICGDMQCLRCEQDMLTMAVPAKYRQMNNFAKYMTGELVAPVLTIFVGGNHEASGFLQSLPYGGYVAPRIYYLGYGSVVRYRGLRIGGLSGIFNAKHYTAEHYERLPYNEAMVRSVYHIRQLDVLRMMLLAESVRAEPLTAILSHDWPQNIWQYGDINYLLKIKPHFTEDVTNGKLGCQALMDVLQQLKPRFWFAAHLHVKFPAVVPHTAGLSYTAQDAAKPPIVAATRFLALDKVLPRRQYLQIISVDAVYDASEDDDELHFDTAWIHILRCTHDVSLAHMLRQRYSLDRFSLESTITLLRQMYGARLVIPPLLPVSTVVPTVGNIQTDQILQALKLRHQWTMPMTEHCIACSGDVTVNERKVDTDPNAVDIF